MSTKLMSAAILPSEISQNKSDNCDKVLKQLLEYVQRCQKRYGGKNELATEFDSCVAGLCLSLEAVFSFGLRNKPISGDCNSTLKQVSSIVAQSLQIGQESVSFWPFIQRHLTKHERERFDVLKHIWTDIGKCKAWIRASLNEKSLERYFHKLLEDKSIIKEYYESWSIIRDEEKNSMLPNMAAGLGSILFAVSIDKPEFNSSAVPRPNVFSNKIEPIIEVPIPERRKDAKKKRKVVRQVISFDDDDSILSTSVPSISSSSTCSDTSSISNHLKEHTGQMSAETMESSQEKHEEIRSVVPVQSNNNNETTKTVRKLSVENSGSREKFLGNVPESLTPVNQSSIGELTPVSVERIRGYEVAPEEDNDILEVPTDISAVLSVVENKNQEEIRRRDERLKLLTKENEALKEQVKKYVSAIRMLGRDEEGLQKALEGVEIVDPPQPDYKGEAKIYEKKLIQIAEMHAELMDFNGMLQQTICQKDLLLNRMKQELEELRGPTTMDETQFEETRGTVNVWIPSAFLTGSGSDSHHVYQIFLRAGNDEWNIYRRYAQFHALHTDLKKLDPEVGSFDFPPKKRLGKKDSALVEDRRKRLQTYLRKIVAHWPELAHCTSRFLLEQHLAFFKNQRDDEAKKNMFASRRPTNSGNYSGL